MNEKRNGRFLEIVDFSYFQYFCIFGAVNDFEKNCPEAKLWLKPLDECDQENLPDLLNCVPFRRTLRLFFEKRLDTIDQIAKANFQDELDGCDAVDVIFAQDDSLSKNFRFGLYPQYKAQRQLVKRQYRLQPLKEYFTNTLVKELRLEEDKGCRFVKFDGAEGDDVIATALRRIAPRYDACMLIASDHDFLQVDGVREFDLFGKEAKRTLGGEEVSAADFLMGKILMGDKSDNIKQVFTRCGPKTALKLVKDRDATMKMLAESQEASDRFLLNRKIIDFDQTPKELVDGIEKKLNEALWQESVVNQKASLKDFMEW